MRDILHSMNIHDGKLYIDNFTILGDIVGLLLFLQIAFFIYYFFKKNHNLMLLLYAAFLIRFIASCFGYYVYPLPDSLWDSRAIEYTAAYGAQFSFYEICCNWWCWIHRKPFS